MNDDDLRLLTQNLLENSDLDKRNSEHGPAGYTSLSNRYSENSINDTPHHHDSWGKVAIKSTVAFFYALPFGLTVYNQWQTFTSNEYIGLNLFCTIGVVAAGFNGYILNGEHVADILLDKDHALEHVAEHLQLKNSPPIDIKARQWSTCLLVSALIGMVLLTFPLGLTKIDLDQSKDSQGWFGFKICLLLVYSAIDAGPHIGHLPLWHDAWLKLREIISNYRAKTLVIIACFAIGHALNDSADLYNYQKLTNNQQAKIGLFIWTLLGLISESGLASIEAIAHRNIDISCKDMKMGLSLFPIMFGAGIVAWFNWFNTYGTDSIDSSSSLPKKVFPVIQLFNAIFLILETYNHLKEHEHDSDSEHDCDSDDAKNILVKSINGVDKGSNNCSCNPAATFAQPPGKNGKLNSDLENQSLCQEIKVNHT